MQQNQIKKLVLCLHGDRQSAEIFQNQISKLIDALADVASFEFLDAPFLLPLLDPEDSVRTRSWCRPTLEESRDFTAPVEEPLVGLHKDEDDLDIRYAVSDRLLKERMRREPFPEILFGFSQGGLMICRYLMRCSGEIGALRAVIFAGTPDPRKVFCGTKVLDEYTKHQVARENCSSSSSTELSFLSDLNSLHIIGRKDKIVLPSESSDFAAACGPNAKILMHEHSHSVPQLQVLFTAVCAFVRSFTEDPEVGQAITEEQANEIEMISMMYGDDCIDHHTHPVVTIVTLPLFDEDQLLAGLDSHTLARLGLQFRLSPRYPVTPPNLSIVGGPTAKSIGFEKWSANLVKRCMEYLVENSNSCGQILLPVRMFASEEANQSIPFLQRVLSTYSNNIEIKSSAATGELADESVRNVWACDDDDDDAKRSQYILKAEQKASSLQHCLPSLTNKSDQVVHDGAKTAFERVSGSEGLTIQRSGGTWTPVIGLIGKPSAGKSTFFNAITNPQNESEAARVAAFPFTTIEPNVGTGFGLFWCPCTLVAQPTELIQHESQTHPNPRFSFEECDACYGHVSVQGSIKYRRHPILVKDVAGLVQGAYQGKGKGNQFLNDLCDASVLIHVVDASGLTDAGGSPCVPGQGSTLEDITWVRKEVHNWIYDNLRAKWEAILRVPKKIRTMFSGYRASPSFVDEILQLIGIVNDAMLQTQLKTWGPEELHLLVALFIRLRFPIIVALNKADLPTARGLIKELQQRYSNENFVCMSAKVEWDLLALHKKGLVEYTSGASKFVDRSAGVNSMSKGDAERLRCAHAFFEGLKCDEIHRERSISGPRTDAHTKFPMFSTGVQDVIADAIRPGVTAEEVFWAMIYKNIIDGKFVRFEMLDILKQNKTPLVLRKTEVLPNTTLLIRVLTNKRQLL